MEIWHYINVAIDNPEQYLKIMHLHKALTFHNYKFGPTSRDQHLPIKFHTVTNGTNNKYIHVLFEKKGIFMFTRFSCTIL
jgi:hypothetical protein